MDGYADVFTCGPNEAFADLERHLGGTFQVPKLCPRRVPAGADANAVARVLCVRLPYQGTLSALPRTCDRQADFGSRGCT